MSSWNRPSVKSASSDRSWPQAMSSVPPRKGCARGAWQPTKQLPPQGLPSIRRSDHLRVITQGASASCHAIWQSWYGLWGLISRSRPPSGSLQHAVTIVVAPVPAGHRHAFSTHMSCPAILHLTCAGFYMMKTACIVAEFAFRRNPQLPLQKRFAGFICMFAGSSATDMVEPFPQADLVAAEPTVKA